MRRVLITTFMVLLVAMVVFAGCASPKPTATPTPSPSPTKPAPSPSPSPSPKVIMPWDEWPIKQIRPEWKWPNFLVFNGTGTRYAEAVALAELSKKYGLINTQVAQIGSGAKGLQSLVKGEADVNEVEPGVVKRAYFGIGEYEGAEPGLIRTLADMAQPQLVAMIARNGSGIKTPADLKGKKIAYTELVPVFKLIVDAMLQAYGLTPNDVKLVPATDTTVLPGILREGQVDAFVYTADPGSPYYTDLTTTGDGYLVSIDADKIDAVVKALDAIYIKGIVPANSFKGQDKDVICLKYNNVLHIRTAIPESMAYTITRILWEHLKEFEASGGPFAKNYISPDKAVDPAYFRTAFHAGAVRYYKEIKVWGAEQEKVQKDFETQLAERLKTWKK